MTRSKKGHDEAARLMIQIFRSSLLTQMAEAKKIPVEFKKTVFLQLARFREIQYGLDKNLPESEILQMKQVKRWLETHKILFSTCRPEQLWNQEVVSSYMILSFPFQETRLRKLRHEKQVHYWENELIEAETLLYHFFDEEAEIELKTLDTLRLHRLLYFHDALFHKNKKIDWLQALSDWAQDDDIRRERIESLLSILDTQLTITPPFPKPDEHEKTRAKTHASFQLYLAARTLHSLEKRFGFAFSENVRGILAKGFKTVSVRQDLAYFSFHLEALRKYTRKQERQSNFFIRNFQLYDAYSTYIEKYPLEEKQLFLDLIFLSQIDNDHSPRLAHYLPHRLEMLSQISFDRAWNTLLPHARLVDTKKESQLIYILGFLIKTPVREEDLLLSVLRPLEILKYYKKNQPLRDDRAALYRLASEESADIGSFEHKAGIISGDFTSEQKAFLFALFEEEAFGKFFHFLQNLASAIERPLERDLAFHLLMGEFQSSGKEEKGIFDTLSETLASIKETLEEKDIDKDALSSCFGELFVQLSKMSKDFDQNSYCFELQYFLLNAFDLIES